MGWSAWPGGGVGGKDAGDGRIELEGLVPDLGEAGLAP